MNSSLLRHEPTLLSRLLFFSVVHSEKQDLVSDRRLYPDAEDRPDVALQEEAQAKDRRVSEGRGLNVLL